MLVVVSISKFGQTVKYFCAYGKQTDPLFFFLLLLFSCCIPLIFVEEIGDLFSVICLGEHCLFLIDGVKKKNKTKTERRVILSDPTTLSFCPVCCPKHRFWFWFYLGSSFPEVAFVVVVAV